MTHGFFQPKNPRPPGKSGYPSPPRGIRIVRCLLGRVPIAVDFQLEEVEPWHRGMDLESKTFPTYPWNIPQTQIPNSLCFGIPFIWGFGEAWGMRNRGFRWGSLR